MIASPKDIVGGTAQDSAITIRVWNPTLGLSLKINKSKVDWSILKNIANMGLAK